MPFSRAEAGSRPACESLSFASPKERNQRKGDPTVCVPCASLRGNLWCSGLAGSRSNSLRFTSLRQSRALIRQTLRSSAHPEGQREQDIPTGLCFARPHLAGASATRCAGQAERSDGPNGCSAVRLFGCSAVHPCWLRLRRGGCGVSTRVEARVLRELTRRGCPSGARQRKASSTAHPATDTTQVCPFAPRRGRRLGVAFSLVTFFWRSKRKLLARRATPGLRPQPRHAAQSATPPNTTKLIATSAYPTSASSQKPLKQARKPSAPKK